MRIDTTAAHPPSFTAYGMPKIPVPWIRFVTFQPARNAEALRSSEGFSIKDIVIVAERNLIKLRDSAILDKLTPRKLFPTSGSPRVKGAFSPNGTTVGPDGPKAISSQGCLTLGVGVASRGEFSAIVDCFRSQCPAVF